MQRRWRQIGQEEKPEYRAEARPSESFIREEEATQRLCAHLRDVWNRCYGYRNRAVLGGVWKGMLLTSLPFYSINL